LALLGLGVIWILKVNEFMSNLSYESILIQENGDPLVDLSTYPFILEPQYYNRGLSDSATLFARKSVADKLIRIQDQLEEITFKIWGPWRLRDAMLEEDFSYYIDEWWPFDYGNQFWAALKGYEVAIYGEIRSAT
jgi:hypothetical protein